MNNISAKTEEQAKFMCVAANEMINQFKNKNIAYGDSFGKQFEKYGPISALVRINDKFTRCESLITGADNKVKDERLEDTLIDMACYCLMTVYELNKNKGDQNNAE